MNLFLDTLEYCELEDLGYHRPSFIWSDVRAGGVTVSCRLDKVVASGKWQEVFPSFSVLIKNNTISNHCAIILHCRRETTVKRRGRPFRFESMWFRHPNFRSVVENMWNKEGPMVNRTLDEKLKCLQKGLKQ